MKSYIETKEITVELNPKVIEMAKQAMAKPKATATQIEKFITRLLEEEVALQEEIKENKRPDVSHYKGKIEVIDFINAHDLNFNRGNVVKYTVRAGKKDQAKEIEDLRKAIHYLEFEIERIQNEKESL
jgi:hypothetical protein